VHIGILWVNLRARENLEDPVIDGKIRLKWIFKKLDGTYGLV